MDFSIWSWDIALHISRRHYFAGPSKPCSSDYQITLASGQLYQSSLAKLNEYRVKKASKRTCPPVEDFGLPACF
jgi:hypothetical protein